MKKIMWIVAMIPVVVTSVVLQFMPDIIPMHHDLEGNTDRWGSKTESFIFPVIILFITLFWHLLIYVFEKKSKNANLYGRKAKHHKITNPDKNCEKITKCKYRKGTDGSKIFCKGIMCCRNFASNHVRDYALFYSLFFLDTGKCRW